MNNGELLSRDSIEFNDSLKFVTKGGKIVYGGGGIMPDVFVPLDTTSYHPSISSANRKDLIRQYAFDYTGKHRDELETQNLQDFIQFFEVNSDDLKALSNYCRTSNIDMPVNEFSTYDTKIITSQLKAYIARNIWNDDGFFPIIHEIDYTFQQAKLQ
jgi:carboxyl-terminal processing protease